MSDYYLYSWQTSSVTNPPTIAVCARVQGQYHGMWDGYIERTFEFWRWTRAPKLSLSLSRSPSYRVLLSHQADFQWASQLKQRFKGESGHSSDSKLPLATIDILDASFEYGFEFLGNGPRLVITPLTDRIYVTATQVRLDRPHIQYAREREADKTEAGCFV